MKSLADDGIVEETRDQVIDKTLDALQAAALATDGERAAWQPPSQAGRYLVQVAADWGRDGLAVDAVVLVVADDGNVSFG